MSLPIGTQLLVASVLTSGTTSGDGIQKRKPKYFDCLRDNEECNLPRNVVNQLINEILPKWKIVPSIRELFVNFLTEFLEYITAEATEIMCHQEKKRLQQEHLYMALDRLGFADYRETIGRDFKMKIEAYAYRKRRKREAKEKVFIAMKSYELQQKLIREAHIKLAEENMQKAAPSFTGTTSSSLVSTRACEGSAYPSLAVGKSSISSNVSNVYGHLPASVTQECIEPCTKADIQKSTTEEKET